MLEDDGSDGDVNIDETDQEVEFEEWVVREVTELGYDVNTSDWGQDDFEDVFSGAWDDLDDVDEVHDDAEHTLTSGVVAENYFKGGTWYLNNWREVPPVSEVGSEKNNICRTDSKNKLGCADNSGLNLSLHILPNNGYLGCVYVQSVLTRKRFRRAAFNKPECNRLTEITGQTTGTQKQLDISTTLSNRKILSARRRNKSSKGVIKNKEVERVGMVIKDEEMDTDSDKLEQEPMEVGSQPAMDHMEVEVGTVYNGVEGVMELVMEATQVEVDEPEDRGN